MIFGKKTHHCDTFSSSNGVQYIIVGLGNPDKKYELTRHNIGFMAVDTLSSDIKRLKFKSLCAELTVGGTKCIIIKPQTYMNNSGEAVLEAMQYYKVPLQNVIVIYDDISLEISKLRIRRMGTHGGHNGIKSIISLCGGENFPRVKLGVGGKPHPDYDLADWVLSTFKKDELTALKPVLDSVADIVSDIITQDIDAAMNKYNGR